MKNLIRIINVKFLKDYKLAIEFSDGKSQVIDFGPFLERSQHLEIRKYLNPKKFKQFKVENGDLMWGDYDLIFPIADLYNNSIDQGNDSPARKTAKVN